MSRFNADFFDKNLNNVHHDTIERPEIDDDYLNPDTSEIYISRTDKVVRLYKIHWSSQEQRKVNTIEEVGGIQNGYLLFFLAKSAKSSGRYSSYRDKIHYEQTGPYIPQSQRFSDIQLAIIDGIIPIDEVPTIDIGILIEKASRLGRKDIVDQFVPVREARKEEYKERLRERRRQEYRDKKNGIPIKRRKYTYHRDGMLYITQRNPGGEDYTDRQKAILRGEIPFEETQERDYAAIERKARKRGDTEVLELVQTLAAEKRADKLERMREQARKHYRTRGYDPDKNYYKRKKLSRWEKAVLYGTIDLDTCDEDHLRHILDVCTLTEDDVHKALAEQLMQYKRDPKTVYKYHGAQALEVIGQLTFMPLPDPKHLVFREPDMEESNDTFEGEGEDVPDYPIMDD